ncbi:prepilin-type N-terminal cleavage/methylation domain-containing protein [Kineococcus sp. R8]|uniref:prepilin-type N-terminal cleavage/methylation domain-containing protein n=1 Tax=Kineococcus siccus TaxID=2696567 RepID=UPI001411BFB1|nr:prepilin-type N-terminal cleavage/methylation domain-containing protein [Kineococcus siccus]
MRNRWRPAGDDEGFTLVEVIVALALLALVAAATLTFFIRGASSATGLQRQQAAVGVATQHLELARSVSPANLLKGRYAAAVDAQWGASTAPDLALTWRASTGPAPTAPAVPVAQAVPLAGSATVSNQLYSTSTLIGHCYRDRAAAGAASAPCTRAGGSAAGVADPGYVKLYRVVVEVTWRTAGRGAGCAAGVCTYRASTLVDPTTDQRWIVSSPPVGSLTPRRVPAQSAAAPVAVDLQIVTAGRNVSDGTRFTIQSSGVSRGKLLVDGVAYDAAKGVRSGKKLTYTPLANDVGSYSLTYTLRNPDGQASEVTTLTIAVVPNVLADAGSVAAGAKGTLDFGANDVPATYGDKVVVRSFSQASGACSATSWTANGTLTFTAGAAGKCTWKYQARGNTTATSGLTSDETTITVTVS